MEVRLKEQPQQQGAGRARGKGSCGPWERIGSAATGRVHGGYGVSLYQIADDQDIEAVTSEDPIVKNGAGHYEHYPMLHPKARG